MENTKIKSSLSEVNVFAKTLAELKKLSSEIIQRSLPIMKEIEHVQNEHVRVLIEEIQGLQPEQALDILQNITLDWIKDAEAVKEEIDLFVISDEDSAIFRINTNDCPTLREVWNGDAYDKSGVEGLQAFRDDLKAQLGGISEENLVKKAREQLLGEDSDDQ